MIIQQKTYRPSSSARHVTTLPSFGMPRCSVLAPWRGSHGLTLTSGCVGNRKPAEIPFKKRGFLKHPTGGWPWDFWKIKVVSLLYLSSFASSYYVERHFFAGTHSWIITGMGSCHFWRIHWQWNLIWALFRHKTDPMRSILMGRIFPTLWMCHS